MRRHIQFADVPSHSTVRVGARLPLALPVLGVMMCLPLTVACAAGYVYVYWMALTRMQAVWFALALASGLLFPLVVWCWKLSLQNLRKALASHRKAR